MSSKTPRKASTYRGARRNAARGYIWRSSAQIKDRSFLGPIYENSKFRRILNA